MLLFFLNISRVAICGSKTTYQGNTKNVCMICKQLKIPTDSWPWKDYNPLLSQDFTICHKEQIIFYYFEPWSDDSSPHISQSYFLNSLLYICNERLIHNVPTEGFSVNASTYFKKAWEILNMKYDIKCKVTLFPIADFLHTEEFNILWTFWTQLPHQIQNVDQGNLLGPTKFRVCLRF